MPEISRFLGIIISMYFREHPPPHFHAKYGEYEATFDISSGNVIDGRLPRRALSFVEDWHKLHINELKRNWDLIQDRKSPIKIEPLE